ncbi:MAG TPA: CvpA family protein [Clostridia bacterium]|nr:CvpA family protein [Clostridia bacterium]
MNWLDLVILIILLAHLIPGFQQGFILQLAGLISIVLGFYCGYLYSPILAFEILKRWEINPIIVRAISFVLITLVVSQILILFFSAINKLFNLPVIGLVNKLAGALLGLVKGGIVVLIGITIMQTVSMEVVNQAVSQSGIAQWFIQLSPYFYGKVKEVIGLVLNQYIPPTFTI